MDTKPTPATRSLQSRNPSRHDGLVTPKKHDKAKTTVHGCQCAGYMDLRVRRLLLNWAAKLTLEEMKRKWTSSRVGREKEMQ